MKRPEQLYLQDIIEACDAIQRFLRRTDETAFMEDELIQSAILQKLIVIGETAARLPRKFVERHPEIEWADIVAFRNFAVHELLCGGLADRLGHGHRGCSPAARKGHGLAQTTCRG
jgi:uncharacterized protein with HEPN domain